MTGLIAFLAITGIGGGMVLIAMGGWLLADWVQDRTDSDGLSAAVFTFVSFILPVAALFGVLVEFTP